MLVFLRRVCVWVGGVFVGVCVCGCGMLICFVSALGSHEMGRHKLPIIIIIKRQNTAPSSPSSWAHWKAAAD